ncbi:hypothetical protein B9Z55_004106 [Caenorhabditis nigoni]|uniref:Uncharacterized protein n=1 Tax=Caenorhabditis nigoni TaxID=1611254 RepID=A0A2G5UVD2_9PELO|nr:hypothetical protein B9Z55_004106 [Caenorhabditis nigoni]
MSSESIFTEVYALKLKAMYSLFNKKIQVQNPSIDPCNIVYIAPLKIDMVFPGAEFFVNGEYSKDTMEKVGQALSRAAWEITRDEVEVQAFQSRQSDGYFNPPQPDEEVKILARARQTYPGVHELEYTVVVERGGRKVKIAVGNSSIGIVPPSEQQQPGPSGDAGPKQPTKKQRRQEKKARSFARKQAEQESSSSANPATAPTITTVQSTRPAPATTPGIPTILPAVNPSGKGSDGSTLPQSARRMVPAPQITFAAPPPPSSGVVGPIRPTPSHLRDQQQPRNIERKKNEQRPSSSAIPATAPPNTATQLTRPAPSTTPANPKTLPAVNPSGKGPNVPTMPQRAHPTVRAVQTVSGALPPPTSGSVGPIRSSHRQLQDQRKERNIDRKQAEQAQSSSTIPVTAQSTSSTQITRPAPVQRKVPATRPTHTAPPTTSTQLARPAPPAAPGQPTIPDTNSTRAAPRTTPAAPLPSRPVSKILPIFDWRYHRNLESSVLQQYDEAKMSFMDEIPQRFMLCGVKNMDDLAKLMLAKRFVPVNIAQSALFFKTPLTVFYFDAESEWDQQKVEKAMFDDAKWSEVFHKDNISQGKFFFARAMPLKTILRTTLIATRIFDHRVGGAQRSETVEDNRELRLAVQYYEGLKIRKNLDPMGLMILQGLCESIGFF